jgi:hypothetical protein
MTYLRRKVKARLTITFSCRCMWRFHTRATGRATSATSIVMSMTAKASERGTCCDSELTGVLMMAKTHTPCSGIRLPLWPKDAAAHSAER